MSSGPRALTRAEPCPEVSVVVPAYNAAETLSLCLAALSAQDFPAHRYEVIVVDDGSTDATAEIARDAGALVLSQANAGPAAARNRGAQAARGELLLFTDADCAPVAAWIGALTAPLADQQVAGAKGAYLTRQRGIVPRFTQVEYEERYDRMAGADTIDFVDTYSAAYRRDIFLANGGFDTIFPTASVEDQELSFRLAEKGYRLLFVPEARVYHRHNPTLSAYARRKYFIGYWKALLARWHPGRMVTDSHTPQTLKLQMVLAAATLVGLVSLLVVSLLNGAVWRLGVAAVIVGLLAFVASALPFLRKVWQRDAPITLPAVGLLWVRALALGAGFGFGLVRFRGGVAGRRSPLSGGQRFVKRSLDIGLGAAGLIFSALPMALIALAVRLDSRGPVLFTQARIGENGKPFRILKFRTMVDGAEEMLPQLVDVAHLAEPAFKLHNDPRVTRVGGFLRRYSLDELPQFINVLRGDMSLVGPRPEEANIVARYTDAQRRRLAVKPGMTGPMQIAGRGDLSFEQRLALELDYIERYSLRRDLGILARTLPAVFRARGAY